MNLAIMDLSDTEEGWKMMGALDGGKRYGGNFPVLSSFSQSCYPCHFTLTLVALRLAPNLVSILKPADHPFFFPRRTRLVR